MWQRFTERVRKIVFYAQEEAGSFGDNYVAPEHLLLAIVRDGDNVAFRILDRLQVPMERIRPEVERLAFRTVAKSGQDLTLTPRAKRVIDLAYDEAKQLNNDHIGTEHLLLGILREGESVAGCVLAKLDVSLDEVRHLCTGPEVG